MRRAPARWRVCARCRSAATMAASMRPRCSFCLRANTGSAPQTRPPSADCGRISAQRSTGSTDIPGRMPTVSCAILAMPRRVSSIRAGRTRSTPIFHADGRLAEGTIALVEVQAYVVAAKRSIASAARELGHSEMADRLLEEAQRLASCHRAPLLVRGARNLRHRHRRRRQAVPCPYVECRPCSVCKCCAGRAGPPRGGRADGAGLSFGLGHTDRRRR